MFIKLKADFFLLGFHYKSDMRISTAEKHIRTEGGGAEAP